MNFTGNSLKNSPGRLTTIPLVAAFFFFLLTLVTSGVYGPYCDELYFIACSKHLAFGYVDHPPMVALLAFVATRIFGETVIGLRVLSGLAGACTVLFSAKLAGALGGGRLSQALAAVSICFASAFPALSSFFSMNPVDVMLCTMFIYVLVKTIAAPPPQRWITLGILSGAGLLNKYTFLVLGFSLVVSLVFTKRWEVFTSAWIYIAGLIGLVMFLPHLMWQIQNGWPTLAFMRNATGEKNLSMSPLAILTQLTIGLNPFTLPMWLGGLLYLLLSRDTKEFRFLGWMVLVFLLVYMSQNSKFYYVLPVIPLLFSSGAVALERFSQEHHVRWPARFMGSAMAISGTLLMPLAVPILPVDHFITYAKTLGLWNSIRMQKGEGDRLPLHFVYRFGWEELVDSVATAYEALLQNERTKCAILASWYGIAGAIDHFGSRHSLPEAICPGVSYGMWGTRNYSGEVVLAVGFDSHFLEQFFDDVTRVAHVRNPYAFDVEIYVCRAPKATLEQMWSRLK